MNFDGKIITMPIFCDVCGNTAKLIKHYQHVPNDDGKVTDVLLSYEKVCPVCGTTEIKEN